jgi:hypothetical protein
MFSSSTSSEEKKDNEEESEETESEAAVENVELELSIDDRIWKFAHSLDRNDKSLWNKTVIFRWH